jgi:pre-mRNA-splicing factor CWC26
VDDDIDLKNMRPLDEDELDLYNLAEDAPQIAGIIDERPDAVRSLEEFRGSRRWKVMSDENGIEDIKVTAIESVGKQVLTSSSSSRNCGKSDLSSHRGYGSTRESKKTRNDLEDDFDVSPPRKSRICSDSDVSPPRKSQAKRGSGQFAPRKDNRGNDSDSSPPRKYKHSPALSPRIRNSAASPTMKEKNKRDLSPVRRNKHDKNLSPVRRKPHDSDFSPVRKSKNEAEKAVSGLRKTKCGVSPPKKSNQHSDLSPPRKFRRSEDYDETPPRNSRKNDSKTDRNQRQYSDTDPSPPRKTSKHESPLVQSRKDSSGTSASVRIVRNDVVSHSRTSDKYEHHESFPVKSKQGDFREPSRQDKGHSVVVGSVSPSRHHDRSDSPRKKDRQRCSPASPSRKSRSHADSANSCSDNSPERPSKRPRNVLSPSRSASKGSDSQGRGKVEDKQGYQDKRDKMKGKMEKTLDGKRAGLQVAGELRQEVSDFKRREDELFAQVSVITTYVILMF